MKHLSGNFVSRCKSTRFCIAKNIRILEFETLEKMFHFCKTAYQCKRKGTVLTAKQCGMSEEQFARCYKKFDKLGISPIPADISFSE